MASFIPADIWRMILRERLTTVKFDTPIVEYTGYGFLGSDAV